MISTLLKKGQNCILTSNNMSYAYITSTSELTTMLPGHGSLKAYYHIFKIIEDPTCTWWGGSKTALWLQTVQKGENGVKGHCKKEWR